MQVSRLGSNAVRRVGDRLEPTPPLLDRSGERAVHAASAMIRYGARRTRTARRGLRYGMGGIWVLIEAESAEVVEERFPWLRVVRIGDPSWITPQKYAEIVESWIPSSMRFRAEPTHGWLAATDAKLGHGGERPERAPTTLDRSTS